MDGIAKGLAAGVALLGLFGLLGSQSARIGTYVVPAISPWWIAALAAAVLLVTPPARALSGRGRIAAGAALLLAFVLLQVVRSRSLHPPASLEAVLEDGSPTRLSSLQIDRRSELRRVSGRRRNVAFQAAGRLEVPRTGRYLFELRCDDFCEVTVGEAVLRTEGALRREIDLEKGEIDFALRYRQDAGPARLSLRWDRPGTFEPLPIDYYVRSREEERRSRLPAHAALSGLAVWWVLFAFFLRALGRDRERWKSSPALPAAMASLLVLYGAVLRFEALLVHSGLASENERAGSIHESLLPWVPRWGIFHPENAPLDPYRADVRSYLDRAEAMGREGFYAPSFREPFYVLLVRGFVALAGGEIGILIGSFAFSVLALVLSLFLARKLHGPLWAAALLVPLGLHQWLVLDSPTGYRESAYAFFLLAFVGAVALGGSSPRWAAAVGVLGGLLCLVRLSALAIVVPLLALRTVSVPTRERQAYAAASALLVALLVGPFLWSNFREHGDPLYSVTFHTQFWLRAEGLDAREGPVSLARYFAGFGRLGSVVRGTLLGLTWLPLRTFWNGMRDFPLLGAATLGLGALGLLLVSRGANRYLTAAYFGHLLAFAYIQNFPSGEMPRFVMPAFFLVVLAIPPAAGFLRRSWSRTSFRQAPEYDGASTSTRE